MKFYVRVARTISHDWRQRTSDILFFRGILWKSLDPSGFSSRCYRSLSAWKMHLHLCRLTVHQVHSAKFERWESWCRSSIRPLCYIRKVGHAVPRWPLDAVIVFILRVFSFHCKNSRPINNFRSLFLHFESCTSGVIRHNRWITLNRVYQQGLRVDA